MPRLQPVALSLRKAKKAPKIRRRGRGQLLRRQVSHRCERPRYFGDVGRLVAPSTKRLRREKRRIRFNQNRLQGQRGGYIAQVLRLRIGRVSCKRNQESHLDSAARFLEGAAETMEKS